MMFCLQDGEENGAPGGGFNQAEDNSQVSFQSNADADADADAELGSLAQADADADIHPSTHVDADIHASLLMVNNYFDMGLPSCNVDLCDEKLVWSRAGS